MERILDKAGVKQMPKADVAVFVGTEFDVIQGRGGDGEPVRKTPWGEIAWQLGGEKALAAVAEHDARGLAPAGDALRAMLPSGPTLILMDELMNYISRGRKIGLRISSLTSCRTCPRNRGRARTWCCASPFRRPTSWK